MKRFGGLASLRASRYSGRDNDHSLMVGKAAWVMHWYQKRLFPLAITHVKDNSNRKSST